MSDATAELVLDASAMVDLLVGAGNADEIRGRLAGATVHVPAHFDAEVLSALGRLARSGNLTGYEASALVNALQRAPFLRHLLSGLLEGVWSRRQSLRLVDAFYVELAERLGVPLLTTDTRLSEAYPHAQVP